MLRVAEGASIDGWMSDCDPDLALVSRFGHVELLVRGLECSALCGPAFTQRASCDHRTKLKILFALAGVGIRPGLPASAHEKRRACVTSQHISELFL